MDPNPVEWWMRQVNLADQRADAVSACVTALLALEPGNECGEQVLVCLRVAKQWFEQGTLSNELQTLIAGSPWHPRVTLLPLLESSASQVTKLALAALRMQCDEKAVDATVEEMLLSRRHAELALGVSAFQLTKMRKEGVWRAYGLESGDGWFSARAVNAMLCRLAVTDDAVAGHRRPVTRSVGSVLMSIVDGKEASAGYDLSLGISSIRSIEVARSGPASPMVGEIGIEEAADILNSYPEAVRSLARVGWIEHRNRDCFNRKRFVADRADVEGFSRRYALAGEIAKSAGTNVTNTAERLMALGVHAVAGPKIDGCLVYVFERASVDRIDLAALHELKGYPTSTGRRSALDPAKDDTSEMTLAEAAKLLGVNVQLAKRLVIKGHLQEIDNQSRQVYVTARSVKRFKKKLEDPNLVPVEDAAAELGMGSWPFEISYVQPGLVYVHDLAVSRRVQRSDIATLCNLREYFLTAEEAGRLLGTHRSHLPNLERRGEIKSMMFGKRRHIKFYALADIQKLMPLRASASADFRSAEE
ncbi:hypothetical protein [Cupriavidus sp. D39]|uniref:hypothetical protein n=1 Tax=Cupriavidus sp. D39 TaxID=2997877 RepID=UPI00226DBB38|nr:hypothetical protein [Cupriavidus sp. D39]MCY0856651.1 hypothetical protein [Cupriavidus sp. D39]